MNTYSLAFWANRKSIVISYRNTEPVKSAGNSKPLYAFCGIVQWWWRQKKMSILPDTVFQDCYILEEKKAWREIAIALLCWKVNILWVFLEAALFIYYLSIAGAVFVSIVQSQQCYIQYKTLKSLLPDQHHFTIGTKATILWATLLSYRQVLLLTSIFCVS